MTFADLWRELEPLGRDEQTGGYRRYSWTEAELFRLAGEPGAALRVGRGPGVATVTAGPGIAAERFQRPPEVGEAHPRAMGTRTPRSVATVAAFS